MSKKQKKMLYRIVTAAALIILLNIIPLARFLKIALFAVCYAVIGYDIVIKAVKGIFNGRPLDENFLMCVASLGAFIIAVIKNTGDYNEAVAVMLFYQLGELFESYAVGKSRKNISALMDIRPDYANIEQNGELVRVEPEEVQTGSIITVNPGEKIPIDGIVEGGSSLVNTSALTGESVPKTVNCGDEVLSGCINVSGVIKIKTTKEFGQSTVSKILELVENASSRKAKSEEFISKFARIYTPAVVYSAVALAVLPPVIRILLGSTPMWNEWIYRALTFLVISCPCALVISIPLSFFAGIGGASHAGVLIKGSNFIETLSRVKTVVFDKTGTLTQGVFEVAKVYCEGITQQKLIEYAALAECSSSHPIAKSIIAKYAQKPDISRADNITEHSGCGVCAVIDGQNIGVGNLKLMQMLGVKCKAIPCEGTAVYVSVNGSYGGCIVVSDIEKATAKNAVESLKANGIVKTVMLTGDLNGVAQSVAKRLGIDEVHSELLPAQKVEWVERLIEQKPQNSALAFVGDGINDAPVLTRADVGIAMGSLGSDAAIEAADVVLMDDNPEKIVTAVKTAKKCMRIVYQNIFFALFVKLACLVLGALGIANMWLAVFADVGVMIIAVLNAVRALKVKK